MLPKAWAAKIMELVDRLENISTVDKLLELPVVK
jgi:hypothetical protein